MKNALDQLRASICDFAPAEDISDDEWAAFAENCVVALAAGGEGARLKEAISDQKAHKTSYRLPTGDTMIERTIRMYREAGVREFVALVFHHAHSVIDLLGDGSRLGVTIRYSHDPEKPVGRGGAIRNALENGSIPRGKSLICHNPDDQIVGYAGNFPRDIVSGHLAGVRAGRVATAVVVEGTPYAYTGMKVARGAIEGIEMYPLIPIPTHIGVTVFSPDVYDSFIELFDLAKKTDFESVLFPLLAEKRQLGATPIPTENWLAVNDPKTLNKLIDLLKE